MPEQDEDMRGLGAMLREAADGGSSQARPADFERLVRHARGRRRAWTAGGAAGLVACVAIGVAVVAGVRPWQAPVPQPPAPVPHAVADKVARLVDLDAVAEDRELMPLITDIAVLAWNPEPGQTVTEVRASDAYFAFMEGNGIKPGQQPLLNDVADISSAFPACDLGGPAILTADSLTVSSLETAAVRLDEVPGVQDARVEVIRGMWFRAELDLEAEPGREDQPTGPVIGLPGIVGGDSRSSPADNGKVFYLTTVTYVGGGVDRAGLDEIKAALAQPWGVPASRVKLTAKEIRPE